MFRVLVVVRTSISVSRSDLTNRDIAFSRNCHFVTTTRHKQQKLTLYILRP